MTRAATDAVRSGMGSDRQHGAVVPPLYLSSNFTFDGFNGKRQYDYTRSGNPTRDELAEAISRLEGGSGSVITASGMAAVTLCLTLLGPKDRLLAPRDCYGGTFRLMTHLAKKGAFQLTLMDPTQPESVALMADPQVKMVWLETPSNPLLRITDLAHWSQNRPRPEVWIVVDNTFLSPLLQSPLSYGADLVVHSTTKYLNGHSDVVGGAVVTKTPALHETLTWWANCLGVTGAPFDSFLTLRGLRTIGARLDIHEQNARALARDLDEHPAVTRVYYPGLSHHPGHEIAKMQQKGFGGMIGFELAGGEDQVRTFLAGLQLFTLAESLGGVESLVAHPATMTHAALSESDRQAAGISNQLLRLSVGIEALEDLREDLILGLNRVHAQVKKNPLEGHDDDTFFG
jgi:cystathionine gamma-synthase